MLVRPTAAAILAFSGAASLAGSSTQPISAYLSIFTETTVAQFGNLCSARLPQTAPQWKQDIGRWRNANDDSLRTLRAIATGIEAAIAQRQPNPSSKQALSNHDSSLKMFLGFQMLAAAQPATQLAQIDDENAKRQCNEWRSAIASGGPLENELPQAILGAKQILNRELESPK